jgi:hypothetical protein
VGEDEGDPASEVGRRPAAALLPADLEAWEAGAELEEVELARGGRIVRPKQ